MRRAMTTARTFLILPILAFCLIALLGCGSQPGGTKTAEGTGKSVENTGSGSTSPRELAMKAAEFLKRVKDGTANAADLTAEFKRHFAPPELAADQAVGYSDSAATLNLKVLATEVAVSNVTCEMLLADRAYVIANGATAGTPGTTLLRLARVGSDWKVDWLGIAPQGVAVKQLLGESVPAQFTALAFVHGILAHRYRLVEGLLSESAKNELGKSTFGNSFDRGALKNKLDGLFGQVTGTTLADTNKTSVKILLTGGSMKAITLTVNEGKIEKLSVE